MDVSIDTEKFPYMTDEQNAEFRKSFYDFEDLEDHAKHLGWLGAVRQDNGFVEGYGPLDECGVSINEDACGDDIEIIEKPKGGAK